MCLKYSPPVSLLRFTLCRDRKVLPKTIPRKLVCLVIVLTMPIWPDGFTVRPVSAKAATVDFTGAPLGYLPLVLRSLLLLVAPPAPQDTMESRASAVARLGITPIKSVAYLDQTITFSAVPADSLDRIPQGVKLS